MRNLANCPDEGFILVSGGRVWYMLKGKEKPGKNP